MCWINLWCIKNCAINSALAFALLLIPSFLLADDVTLRVKESVFGGSVHLRLAGDKDKPAVVLIHGLGDAASQHWNPTINRLKDDFRVLAFDLPGFGKSDKGNHLYSPGNYARVVRQLTGEYLGKQFKLVGHSMGGAVALYYAATYPDDVESLALIDTAGILHRAAYTKYLAGLGINTLFAADDALSRNELLGWVGDLISEIEGHGLINPSLILNMPAARQQLFQGEPTPIAGLALVTENFSRIAHKVRAPTLIMWGANDPITPLRTGYVLDAVMPKSVMHVVPDAGHSPLWESPDKSHALLLAHLRDGAKSTIWKKPRTSPSLYRETVRCEDDNTRRITGRVGVVVVKNCQTLLIRDAVINKLVLVDSTVEVLSSIIDGGNSGIETTASTLNVTASLISGAVGIVSRDSRLDIAGSQFLVATHAIEANAKTRAVFSLVHKKTREGDTSQLHGVSNLAAGERL